MESNSEGKNQIEYMKTHWSKRVQLYVRTKQGKWIESQKRETNTTKLSPMENKLKYNLSI